MKVVINITFLLIVLITSLPVKHASRLFFKKQATAEMCDDCCDAPEKKGDNTIGFKEYPYYHHYSTATVPFTRQNVSPSTFYANWRLPLWPAVEVHTPPPNKV